MGRALTTGSIIATVAGAGGPSVDGQTRSSLNGYGNNSAYSEQSTRGRDARDGTTRRGNDTRGNRKKK